mgnify:CR=1 FL=1
MNSSAQELLLGDKGPVPSAVPLADVAPQLATLADARLSSGIVNWTKGGELLTLAVKVADTPDGRVITLEDITRQILEVLARTQHPVTIVTKSALVTRDIDLLAPMAAKGLARIVVRIGDEFALFAAHGGHQVAVDLVALTGQQQFGGTPNP